MAKKTPMYDMDEYRTLRHITIGNNIMRNILAFL